MLGARLPVCEKNNAKEKAWVYANKHYTFAKDRDGLCCANEDIYWELNGQLIPMYISDKPQVNNEECLPCTCLTHLLYLHTDLYVTKLDNGEYLLVQEGKESTLEEKEYQALCEELLAKGMCRVHSCITPNDDIYLEALKHATCYF